MAANNQGAGPSRIQGPCNIISVYLPRSNVQKKFSILKFNEANNVDFKNSAAKLERENNFKEFKSAYDLDMMPKFGAGSEFGREQKEEARKKKYGIKIKKYNPQDQPWQLKLGTGKQARRFKGKRNGGILENASYYMFAQRDDGSGFEVHPVEEWYDFMPQAKYKALTADEAEEEFSKRDKILNHFAIMVSKRIKSGDKDDADGDEAEAGGKKKSNKKDKSLLLTEMDEWGDSDDDNDGDDDEGDENKDEDENKSKKNKKEKKKKKSEESDQEAMEEQDEFDEGQEIDYISGSSSDDEQMYDEKGGDDEDDKYREKGVVDEDGLKKLLDSDEDEEEEEKKDEDNDEDEDKAKEEQDKESDSESSSDSDLDSDAEKEYSFASPLFFKKPAKKQPDETDGSSSNRPTTPSPDAQSNGKRKKTETQSPQNAAKKPKLENTTNATTSAATSSAPSAGTSSSSSASQGDGGIEGLVKRYLSRKPITSKDLLQKVTSKYPNMPKTQVVGVVGNILQRLKLEKSRSNNKTYFSIKTENNN